jgi:hypothetical protein
MFLIRRNTEACCFPSSVYCYIYVLVLYFISEFQSKEKEIFSTTNNI